jgi:proteasome lid subunit RPN8/RPN11
VCGFVVRRGDGELELAPVPNAAPPGEAAIRFAMDGPAQLRVLLRLEEEGGGVVAVYHSHVEAAAVPSVADLAGAVCAGRPAWPGVEHVIISLRGGRAVDIRRYRLANCAFAALDVD